MLEADHEPYVNRSQKFSGHTINFTINLVDMGIQIGVTTRWRCIYDLQARYSLKLHTMAISIYQCRVFE